MNKKKSNKSSRCAENYRDDLEEALRAFSLLVCDWHGHEKSDPNDDAIHYLDVLDDEHGVDRVLSGAFNALEDYEQLLRCNCDA